MSAKPMTSTLRELRTLFQIGAVGTWSDSRLVDEFRTRSGPEAEAAFSTLVNRHGPMVRRVCRGVLKNEHDAQDAFQATFLVLVLKARSVRNQASIASWLYGVAHRVASRARVEAIRRESHERRVAETLKEQRTVETAGNGRQVDDHDHAVIDEEIRRLPEKYRAPVVLCLLEGLTQEQAAEQLGWPSGTVRGRLSRARELLRTRLSRRGLMPEAGMVMAGLTPKGAWQAVVPASLLDATVQASLALNAKGSIATGIIPATVAALAEGTVKAMTYSRLKPLIVLLTGLGITYGASATVRMEVKRSPAVVDYEPAANPLIEVVPPVRSDDRLPRAVVYPLSGIAIDGKLDDWPRNIVRYRIEQSNGQGKRNQEIAHKANPSREKAYFSVGYSPEEQLIYLAVVVPDPIPVVGNLDPWHTDAVEVFVDGLRTNITSKTIASDVWDKTYRAETMPVIQYAGIPDTGGAYGDKKKLNPTLVYGDITKTRTVMAWSRKDGIITYEWAIQVWDHYPASPTKLAPGKRIGFDVAVLDQNLALSSPDGRQVVPSENPTYTCWAPWRTFKGADASSLGDLILGAYVPSRRPPAR